MQKPQMLYNAEVSKGRRVRCIIAVAVTHIRIVCQACSNCCSEVKKSLIFLGLLCHDFLSIENVFCVLLYNLIFKR